MRPLFNAETRTTIVRFVKSVLLFVALAMLESGVAAAGPPADAGNKDVTITVVDDPDQLNEKVNTLRLPADDENSQASAKPGKEARHGKPAGPDKLPEHGKKTDTAAEGVKSDAEDTKRDAVDKAQGDIGDSKQDANDVQQQDARHPDGGGT
jgi:hypothetical protein